MTQTLSEIVTAADVPEGLLPVADEATVRSEVATWRAGVLKPPGLWDSATRGTQERINRMIPEQVHAAITAGVEGMTRGILYGSDFLMATPARQGSLAAREVAARAAIAAWRTTASVEGGIAGAGGFMLAAADFPALMMIKLRLLGEIVAAYGWGDGSVRERLFLLHIFHLAFASAKRRPGALAELERWMAGTDQPEAIADYDWRGFQIEYRDYIDLAKMAQLIPVVGAPIGAAVNWRLVEQLGETAIMACRMRWLTETNASGRPLERT